MSEPVLNELGAPLPKRNAATKLLEIVCAVLLAMMVVLLFTQVVARYALSDPPEWTEELGRTVFAYCTFLGAALAVQRNAHLRIDTLVNLLPPSLKKVVRLLMSICAIVFLCVVLWYSSVMLPKLAFQPLTALPFLSKAWFFAAVPIGCGIMLIYELHVFWKEIRLISGGGQGEH